MTDFIRDNFLILWLSAAVIIILLGVFLKRKGIKVEDWESPPENDEIKRIRKMGKNLRENPAMDYVAGNIHYKPEEHDPTRNKINSILFVFLTVILLSCGGGSGGDGSSNNPDPIEHGPGSGTWQGEAKNIVFTLYVDGTGPTYAGHIVTSNQCYENTSCELGIFNRTAELICNGWSGNFYTMLTIGGEYDGDKTITGEIHAEFCNDLYDPIVLNKISDIQ